MAKRRWAMTIDLARCTGCSACVTACYAENNIPTVGAFWQNAHVLRRRAAGLQHRARPRDELDSSRALLRGQSRRQVRRAVRDALRADALPALRQRAVRAGVPGVRDVPRAGRAERAGLQPLRRHALLLEQLPVQGSLLQLVRLRRSRIASSTRSPSRSTGSSIPTSRCAAKGVMEKCTFCVQRIREAENRAALEHRELQPDEFTTACAQACPSRAITFGDAADPNWTVTQLAHDRRAYHVFEELNTFTAVVYLKKVNHPARRGSAGGEHRRRGHGIRLRLHALPQRPNVADGRGSLPGGSRLRAGRQRDCRYAAADARLVRRARRSRSCACSSARRRWIYQIHEGLGAAGYQPPVMWGVYIITFVFWVGIGHAGTLISAILYLFRAGFRTSIYRVRRSDDGVRGHDGRIVPDPALGPAVEVLLSDSVSELAAHLAESQEPAGVGRVRDPHVPHDLEHLPLHRADSRHRDPARPREESGAQGDPRDARRSAGGTRIASGGTSRARICSSPRSRRRSCSRCTRSCRSTSRWRSRRAGTRRSSRRTSSPAPSSPASGMVFTIIIPLRKFFKLEHYVTLNDLDAAAKLCLFTSLRRRPRVPDRVPGRVDERQQVRAGLLLEPRVRPVGVGRVDHAHLQHGAAAVALLAEAAAQPDLALHPVALHQPRHVVRAVRDRRAVALARVRAVAVGHVPPDVGRLRHPARQLRLVLHVVPAVHQAAARDGDVRDQGDRAAAHASIRTTSIARSDGRRPTHPDETGVPH